MNTKAQLMKNEDQHGLIAIDVSVLWHSSGTRGVEFCIVAVQFPEQI